MQKPILSYMKKYFCLVLVSAIFLNSCFTVKFISGYDEVLDVTVTKMKRDFNLHFIRLSRTFQDNDPNNQQFENFQDYYDNLEADLIVVRDRTKNLDGKSTIVKEQVQNLDATFTVFIAMHKKGFADRPKEVDDRHSERDAVNSSMDAVIYLQESLKTTGKAN